jgi:hypothetical protein
MNELIVCMSATDANGGMLPKYIQRLKKAGVEFDVEAVEGSAKILVTLGSRVPRVRRLAKKFSHYKRIVISDAYDVMFFGEKESVFSKIPEDCVLLSGERNCYPDITLQDWIQGPTQWKYANGGLMAGSPESLVRWADAIEAHPLFDTRRDDQAFYNNCLFQGRIPETKVDYGTELFYCLYGETNELQFRNGIPENTVTGKHPQFIHANGHWPCSEVWNRFDLSIGVDEPVELIPVKIPFTATVTIEVCRKCRDRLIASNLGLTV